MRLSNEDDLREGPEPLSSGRPSLPMHLSARVKVTAGRARQLFLSLLSWERAVPNVTRLEVDLDLVGRGTVCR
jgi:hypothetical protein